MQRWRGQAHDGRLEAVSLELGDFPWRSDDFSPKKIYLEPCTTSNQFVGDFRPFKPSSTRLQTALVSQQVLREQRTKSKSRDIWKGFLEESVAHSNFRKIREQLSALSNHSTALVDDVTR